MGVSHKFLQKIGIGNLFSEAAYKLMWKYWIRAFQPEGRGVRSDRRHKVKKNLDF